MRWLCQLVVLFGLLAPSLAIAQTGENGLDRLAKTNAIVKELIALTSKDKDCTIVGLAVGYGDVSLCSAKGEYPLVIKSDVDVPLERRGSRIVCKATFKVRMFNEKDAEIVSSSVCPRKDEKIFADWLDGYFESLARLLAESAPEQHAQQHKK